MNHNILAYSIYLPIICILTIRIGWLFYKNGEVFLLNLFNQNVSLVKSVNNLLLAGYYLTNIGYAIITISYWEELYTIKDLIDSVITTVGRIVLILSVLHYNNILLLKRLHKTNLLKQ